MSAATPAAAASAADHGWLWPAIPDRYDCCPELAPAERTALRELGLDLLRRCGHGGEAAQWRQIGRLLRPVDDARAVLWCPGTGQHLRLSMMPRAWCCCGAPSWAARSGPGPRMTG